MSHIPRGGEGVQGASFRLPSVSLLLPHQQEHKKTKHMLLSGFWKFPVHKVKEFEELLMCNKSYRVEIVHNVSSKNCKAILERAAQLAIKATNSNVRLHSKENE